MRLAVAWVVIALLTLGGLGTALAADMKDKVKVEVENVSLQPGMDPGTYVCPLGHLHVKGTAENLAGVALGPIKVAGRAFGADGALLGTATASTRPATLRSGEKGEIDLEFPTVTGPRLREVKRHEVTVIEAPVKP